MKFTSTLLATALVGLTSALPSEVARRGMPGGVYICTEWDWEGDCRWLAPTPNCHIASKDSWGNTAESIGPDKGSYCLLFKDNNCKHEIQYMVFPGMAKGIQPFSSMVCDRTDNFHQR